VPAAHSPTDSRAADTGLPAPAPDQARRGQAHREPAPRECVGVEAVVLAVT